MKYTIKFGDTLYKIAHAVTGNGDRWNEIWRHNMLQMKSGNHELIHPGEIVELPPEWTKFAESARALGFRSAAPETK
jgi:nucleoid-associated protein YgaU